MEVLAQPAPDAAPVLAAPGLMIESPIRYSAQDWDGYDVEAEILVTPFDGERAGRLVCRGLAVLQRDGGPAVTTEVLRSVPVAGLVRDAGARSVEYVQDMPGGGVSFTKAWVTAEMAERFRQQGPTPEVLEWVARTYRLAAVLGDPPTRAVEAAFGVPRSTAGRWVAAARTNGMLSAAEGPGRVGG